ncbi:MAG: hypothetical protein ACYDHO_05030 [Gaiellaceae bacterium]
MPSFRPLFLGIALVSVLAIPAVAVGDDALSASADTAVAVIADPSLLTTEPVALPYSSLPDSASLSGDTLVSGQVLVSEESSEVGGVVYALALPNDSTMADASPDTIAQLTPVAQGRVALDGSFTLKVDGDTDLTRFADGDSNSMVTFNLVAGVGYQEYVSAFSRSLDDSGNPSDSAPSLTMSKSSPVLSSDDVSKLDANTAVAALNTTVASVSVKSAKKTSDKSNKIIYSGDERGHKIVAPKALVDKAIYLVRHTPLSCTNYYGCQTWLYWGTPKYPLAKIGETFTGSYIKGKYDYRISARSEFGVAFAGSGDIGGFYEGSTVGQESSVSGNWNWTSQNAKKAYKKQIEYKRMTWWHVYYEPYVGIRLVNYHDQWIPVSDTGGFGSGAPTPPTTTYCVQEPGNFTWSRDSNKFQTYTNGVEFKSPSLISKYASFSIKLSSQTGASEYAAMHYHFNRSGWMCGNTSVGPQYSPRIRSFHNAPSGWQYPDNGGDEEMVN